MANTAHYDLYVTDDATEKFIDWRQKMNSATGTTDSNMVKIDNALYAKANKATVVNTNLTTAGWSGSGPYTQTLSITGMTANSNGSIGLNVSATDAQRNAARLAVLGVSAQGSGTLTVVADGIKPTVVLPVTVIIMD